MKYDKIGIVSINNDMTVCYTVTYESYAYVWILIYCSQCEISTAILIIFQYVLNDLVTWHVLVTNETLFVKTKSADTVSQGVINHGMDLDLPK